MTDRIFNAVSVFNQQNFEKYIFTFKPICTLNEKICTF